MAVAVVQPLPGIGDMIWHLPHINAIAAHYGEPVTLVAKPRSLADQLMEGDPAVRDVLWVDLNPEGRRGAHDGLRGIVRLASELRTRWFRSCIMLHHSHTIAAAALLAGIPDRHGYGWGAQRWLLSGGPYLPKEVARLNPNARATRFLEGAGIALPSAEPRLSVRRKALAEASAVLASLPRPFVALGIGSSEPSRQFGAARHAELAAALLKAGWAAVALIGGPGDRALADRIVGMMGEYAGRTIPILGLRLQPSAALLSLAAFYVGNNTGMMNLSAAVGVRTYGLFGTYPPFDHASQIVPILSPQGGPEDGMTRMTTDAVLEAIRADRGNLAPRPEVAGEIVGSNTALF
ncbi:MAG TPA: glycosyltransferase family 9 protein [Acetobacteraceae bacterium]|jgi:heptosyltransferase-2|nr:glycosyltransferase family 9 protein [Acetobacteraceae bacterium]